MFTNPTEKKPFPKLLLAGKSGTGKTAFCLSAGAVDKPVAILDAEHGTDLMASGYLGPGGKCELHATGFKPAEGRYAIHKEGRPEPWPNLHLAVAKSWDTKYGRAVVRIWKREVGYGRP